MDTNKLKRFAQDARQILIGKVGSRIDFVLAQESAARREQPRAVAELEREIAKHGKDAVIDKVAYTWFNRFTALQYMDMNGHNPIRIIAPSDGQTRPEILAEASAGIFNEDLVSENTSNMVAALLDGRSTSNNPETEAYRLLIVSACNYWHGAMPFLFEKIADYTELLMPDDLLSVNSILYKLREVMTVEDCQDIEIIGWLYQFYISEKKDEVFADLKKNKKITAEKIPAATQLFTPHWIVRYLVENSLGRLWLLNNPSSKLAQQMEYYIAPEQAETDYLQIKSPEEIKICDPACGSGHMLTYAFDLLYAIYEEAGYDSAEISDKILAHNLYGIEIDDRAGALAAFALTMKATSKRKRFLRKPVQPNICVLENVQFEDKELAEYIDEVGKDLFTSELRQTLKQFNDAKNLGSLIVPILKDVSETKRKIDERNLDGNLFMRDVHARVKNVLRMVEYLGPHYHVVIANPPYMGGKGMNTVISDYLKSHYKDVKSDLFSAFIVRNTKMSLNKGQLGFMTPFVWMFISSYEKLRIFLLEQKTITSLIQLEYSGFDGATVPICTFTIANDHKPSYNGAYVRLADFVGPAIQQPKALEAIKNQNCGWFYRASSGDFKSISGNPIAYWVSEKVRLIYKKEISMEQIAPCKQGIATADNGRFLRRWHEVSKDKIGINYKNAMEAKQSGKKWFPYNKGGEFRLWYGNNDFLINWQNDGQDIKATIPRAAIRNPDFFFKNSITWTLVSSSKFGVRYSNSGALFDVGGSGCFPAEKDELGVLGYLGSKLSFELLKISNPTLNFQVGNIASLPIKHDKINNVKLNNIVRNLIEKSKSDWDAYERSWDFVGPTLLKYKYRGNKIKSVYESVYEEWQIETLKMKQLEEENNHTLIETYGLKDELTPDVPLEEITLTCNPAYRYGGNKSEEELEALLLEDTMREFISYAVGCMFGRYSLDQGGLILADQGDTVEIYLSKISNPTFMPDEDNIIPILDGDWFEDDATERFKTFLRVTFGDENFTENLRFIETAIGKDIRKFFLKEFYDDHVKRYKKRPIYWLFTSPRGSFNALIYMHRYNKDTVSVLLDKYLREFKSKLSAEKVHNERIGVRTDSTPSEKTRALNEIEKINRVIDELETWERDVIYPLATQRIDIDLDDGVKANYPKFGSALKKITGLDADAD